MRRTRRRRWTPTIAGLVALAALLAPSGATAASTPLSGDAYWVWYVSSSGGSGEAIAREAERRGLDAVYVKSGDGGDYWSQFTPDLVDSLHDRGIDVCAWQYVYGARPSAEARVAARAVKAGADCFIIDAEAEYEGRYAEADTYVRELRRRVGPDYPLALSTFPYVDYHPAFPYSVFLGPGGAQYNVPQVYWFTIGTSVLEGLSHTFSFNRPYDRPILPVGQTYENPPNRDLRSFRSYARAFDAPGVSWWSWQETAGSEWRRTTGRTPPPPDGFRPNEDYADLEPGSSGDLVVWAQQLLLGSGMKVTLNGRFNRRTERAVLAFQDDAGLPATGLVDDETWVELLAEPPARVRWSRRGARELRSGAPQPAPASATLAPRGVDIPPEASGSG